MPTAAPADLAGPAGLPVGFVVRLDPRARVLGGGRALLGGSPLRLLRLAPAAAAMIRGGRLAVRGAASGRLARTVNVAVRQPWALACASRR